MILFMFVGIDCKTKDPGGSMS